MKDSKKGLYGIIIFLCLIIITILLGGYVLYKKNIINFNTKTTTAQNSNTNSSTNNTTNDTTKTVTEKETKSENKEIEQSKVKSVDLTKYNGIWYESKLHSEDLNPNTLTIKAKDNSNLELNLYVTRTAEFESFSANIDNNLGKFKATSENGLPKSNSPASIEGTIELLENSIKLSVTNSNTQYIDEGKTFIFNYVK